MFDEIEICYRHINLVLSKMNELHSLICDGSDISNLFKENSTINNIQKLQTALRSHAPLPKTNFPAKIFENKNIQLANKTIFYFLKYMQFAEQLILQYNETTLSGVFKCNQLLTIRFCHLIVIFSKLVFFFSRFPICSQIFLALNASNNSKQVNKEEIMSNPEKKNELIELILECTSNPEYINSKLMRVKSYIQNIISEVANTVICFNNNYNFEQFSIFYSEPAKMTTLPSLEYILMINYRVIHDMLQIVFYTFYDLVRLNQPLARSIFTESNSIYLSSNILFKFDEEKIQKIFFRTEADNETNSQLFKEILVDSQENHNQKIKYLLFLLKDYLNYAHFSFDLVMDNYVKLVALTNYAIYEISNYLAFEVNNSELNFVFELLSTLVDLIDIMNSKSDDIKRYYLFNLAVNDLHFLIEGMKEFQIINSSSNELLPMINFEEHKLKEKAQFLPTVYNELFLMAESLKLIDLEKYDSGEKYDFLPFNINVGRLLFYFFKNMHNSSGEFANKVLEHLNTILLHIGFVEVPYSSYCDFSILSNFAIINDEKKDIVSKCKIGKGLSFNYYVSLIRILENVKKDERLSKDVQYKILLSSEFLLNYSLERLQSHFQYILSNMSPFMNNSYSSTPISISSLSYQESKAEIQQPMRFCEKNLDEKTRRNQAKFMRNNYEVHDFYNRILQITESLNDESNQKSILTTLRSQIVKEAPLFAYHSHKNLIRSRTDQILSVSDIKRANFTLIEYFWPLFITLDLPFKRTMYNSRLNQSMVPGDSHFLQQFRLYDGNVGQAKTVDQKLFVQYSNYLEEFLSTKQYSIVLYQTANNGFFPTQWLSSSSIKDMIDDFGPYMALNLDVILVNHISDSIAKIYQNFYDNSSLIENCFKKFKDYTELPEISEIEEKIFPCVDEMIKLGSTVAIRRLLRSQVAFSCEQNMPGFMQVLAQGIKSSLGVLSTGNQGLGSLETKEQMITEIFSGSGGGSRNLFLSVDDEFSFVRSIIQNKKLPPYTDFSSFCFYLALMLLADNFTNIRYYSSLEAIDGNVHLFPIAMSVLIDCASILFQCLDGNTIKHGLALFLTVYSTIYRLRSNKSLTPSSPGDNLNVPLNETLESLQYLATLFPKYIKPLEYGRLEEGMPLLEMTQILSESKKSKKTLI